MVTDKSQIYEYIKEKQLSQAETSLQELCKTHSSDPEIFYLLGQTLGLMGRLDEAAAAFRRVIELQPSVAVGYGSLGSVLHRLGRFAEAADCLEKACEILPEDEGYHLELVECLEHAGRRQDAFQECHKLLDRHPEFGRGYQVLGTLCFCAQQYRSAIENYSKALEYSPELPGAHVDLGKVFTTLGEFDRARQHYETVLNNNPGHLGAIAGLAILHERCGETEEAYRVVRRVVEAGHRQTTIANVYANICHRFDDCDEAVKYAESTLESLAESVRWERKVLHFTLGRRYDKLGEYDKAFRHYQQANSQFPINYDPAAHTDLVTRIIQTFSPVHMMSAPRASSRSSRPVFIVGMPRSGTSLMEQVIGSHPEVAPGGELENISDMISLDSGIIGRQGGYPGGVPKLTGAQLDTLAETYYSSLREISADARYVTDKMPHNFMALGLIAQLFPGARVIHCMRDPLDTCLSIYFQDFTRHHDYAVDLENIGTHYRQYLRLMRHWRNVLDIPMIEVDYRDMIENQASTVSRLLEFCDLEWNAACLDFHQSKRVVNTASYSQVTQPIYRKSVERWRHYEPYLDKLKAALERDY